MPTSAVLKSAEFQPSQVILHRRRLKLSRLSPLLTTRLPRAGTEFTVHPQPPSQLKAAHVFLRAPKELRITILTAWKSSVILGSFIKAVKVFLSAEKHIPVPYI